MPFVCPNCGCNKIKSIKKIDVISESDNISIKNRRVELLNPKIKENEQTTADDVSFFCSNCNEEYSEEEIIDCVILEELLSGHLEKNWGLIYEMLDEKR